MSTSTLLVPDYYAPPSPPKPPAPTKPPKPHHHSSPRVGLIIGISAGVFFVFLIVVYIVYRSRHHHDDEKQHEAELPVLSSSAPVSAASSTSAAAAASNSTTGTAVATASSTLAPATSSSRSVTFPSSSSSSQTSKVEEENTQVIVDERNPWMLLRDVRGMPEAKIDALCRGRYSANSQDVGRSSTLDHVYGVCHYRFASNDDVIILHPCRHPVHIQCGLTYLPHCGICPSCKITVRPIGSF